MPDEPAQVTTSNAGIRTGLQTGVSVSIVVGALKTFNIFEMNEEQILYAAPFLAAAGTIVWRWIENRLGKGLLREVQS